MCDNANIRMQRIIKLLNNRLVQLFLSGLALFYAYKTVDFTKVVLKISQVPAWFTIFLLVYTFFVGFLAVVRWGIILFGKPNIRQLLIMYKNANIASFYSMFLPTPLAGDGIKWAKNSASFKDLSKSKILASILVDRVIGLSTLGLMGFVSVIIATISGYRLYSQVVFMIGLLFAGIVVFYLILLFFNFDRYFGKNKYVDKLIAIDRAFRQEQKQAILKAVFVSFFAQIVWILPIVFSSNFFVPGLPILAIYSYMPIISLFLAFPISFGGFGAREAMYQLFFSPLGFSVESLLALSAFVGVIQLLGSLISGLFVFL